MTKGIKRPGNPPYEKGIYVINYLDGYKVNIDEVLINTVNNE
jgi:hypothetical protein